MSSKKRPSLIERGARVGVKELIGLPEFIGNIPENTIGATVRYFAKKFGPEKLSEAIKALEKMESELPESEAVEVSKKLGIIKDIAKAETYGEKATENLAKGVVNVGTGAGAIRALSSLPKAASTIGGLVSQSLAQPKIEEFLPNSPIAQTFLNVLTGITGSIGGSSASKAFKKQKPVELPKATAGQLAEPGSERSDLLLSKQLDLTKKDYKSAKALSKIQKNQHQEVVDMLTPKSKTEGSEVVKSIQDSFENLKKTRAEQYQAARDNIFNNYQGEAPDLTPTFDLIDKLVSESSKGGKIAKALGDISQKIYANKDSLSNLNSTKTDIQSLTQGFGRGQLHLSDQQSALIKMVAHQLGEDIEKSVPEIAQMNAVYRNQTQQLQKLQKGIVGKSVKAAENKPSEIFKRIFEKTDPELISQFKEVIPEDLYEKAAEQYLGTVLQTNLGKPTRNITNQSNKFFNLRSNLEKNRDQLSGTLPEKYNKIANEAIEKIQISERGVPRNDFTIQSNRNVAVGDETKGLGIAKNYLGKSVPSLIGAGTGYLVGGLPGALLGTAAGTGASQIGSLIKNKALRQEMLTGLSPSQQAAQSISNVVPQVGIQYALGESLTKKPKMEEKNMDHEKINSNIIKTTEPKEKTEISNVDDRMDNFFNSLEKNDTSFNTSPDEMGSRMDNFFNSLK